MWTDLPATLLSKLRAQIGGHLDFGVAAIFSSVSRHWGWSTKVPRWYIEAETPSKELC